MEPLDAGSAISVWVSAQWKGTRTSQTADALQNLRG